MPVVSGGSTGTFLYSMKVPGVNEIQAGSYVTMDAKYKSMGADFENALTLLVTVISRPNDGLAVIDSGMKAITQEFGWPTALVEGATIKGLSEEHGSMIVTGAARDLRPGDKIEIVPSRLHDHQPARQFLCDGRRPADGHLEDWRARQVSVERRETGDGSR